jgi:hypothetical protein
MNTTPRSCFATTLAATALCLALAPPTASAQVRPASSVEVRDWDVYVDLPTRFAFVKLPNGWVFVRQLDEEQMTRLPASTLTALLPADDGDMRYAHPALEPSPRVQAMRNSETRQAGVDLPDASARR